MKIEDDFHLEKLINRVEKMQRLHDALPSVDVMSDAMEEEYKKLSADLFSARVEVYKHWEQLIKESW